MHCMHDANNGMGLREHKKKMPRKIQFSFLMNINYLKKEIKS